MRRKEDVIGQTFRTRWARLFDESGWLNPNLAAAMREARTTVPDPSDPTAPCARDLPRPLHSDWVWRPEMWSIEASSEVCSSGAELTRGTKLFHDGSDAACRVAQEVLERGGFGVAIEADGFSGSFISLAIDLPKVGLEQLGDRHLVRVAADIAGDGVGRVFVRLNLKVGPNLMQFQSEIGDRGFVEFDLVGSALRDAAAHAGWLDLIVEAPETGRLEISDLTVSRRPRADM